MYVFTTKRTVDTIIDNTYKLKKLIGSGGMGDVYLADDLRLDREIVLKIIKTPENIENIQEYEERFKNEAKAVAKLTHSNIVSIYDIGVINNSDYMVMEYVDGKDLHSLIKETKLSIKNIMKITKQLCEVINFIHSKNILHRDIKTQNILITKDFNVKLTDFGIAKNTDSKEQSKLTQAGSILGSIMYSPPEQFINVKNLDNRSDIYSLGVCLYEMLTGEPPFFSKSNVQEIIFGIIGEQIEPPSFFSNKIPKSFDDFILKALNKDPDKRYQNMQEFCDAFEILDQNMLFTSEGVDMENITLEDLKNNTLIGKNSLFNTISKTNSGFNVRDTRLTSTLDLTNTTLNLKEFLSEFYSNFDWIDSITEKYNKQQVNLKFEDILYKIKETDINNKFFSGIICSKNYYLFISQGILFGAFQKNNSGYGDEILKKLYDQIDSTNEEIFELIINIQQDDNVPFLIYYTLTEHLDILHSNLNSATVNLFEVLDTIKSQEGGFNGYITCKKIGIQNSIEKYIFCYKDSTKLFAIKIFNKLVKYEDSLEIEELLNFGNTVISIFKPNFFVPDFEINQLMIKSELYLNYRDKIEGTLEDIVALGKEEVSHCLGEAVKDNIYLEPKLKNSIENITFLGKTFPIKEIIKENNYYKTSLWIITEFLFLINITNNMRYFKELYKSTAEIVKFSVLDELQGFYGCSNHYSIIAKNKEGKIVFLARFGNGSKEDVEIFLEETVLVKKNILKEKKKELFSAFYVSTNKIDNMAITHYYKTVKQEAGLFNKAKAYMKVSLTDGFNVLLLQKDDKDINLVVPNLYQ
ncbi:MAG: serine/threonine-protein kinase [Candidatus Sericytochromatia bacterium]